MADKAESAGAPSPSWLDRDFAERALRAGSKDPTIKVRSVKVTAANAVGVGYVSDMYRLTITLEDLQERRLVIKIQPQGGYREERSRDIDAFAIETRMFSQVLPVMFETLEQVRPGEYQPLAAKYYYHGDDPIPFVVLEDLRESGFTLTDKRLGMDLAHCSLAMKSLGRFHAQALAVHEQNPSLVERFDRAVYSEHTRAAFQTFVEYGIKCMEYATSKWPGFEKYASKFKNLRPNFFDRLIKAYERKDGDFNLLNHGDPWNNNIMFKYSDDTVQDVRFVDYQFSYYGSPALDLLYFMYTCPTDEIRSEHTDNLIRSYHEELVKISEILGIKRPVISLQGIHKAMDDYLLFGFYVATVLLPINHSDPTKDDQDRKLEESDGSFKVHEMYGNPVYIKIIQRLLPIFEDKGIFKDV